MRKLFSILLLLTTTLALVYCTTETTTTDGTETTSCDCSTDKEAILLQDIKELVFLKGALTLSRREPAIPQLDCVGGSAKGVHEPNSVRCVNTGNTEPHWRCEATLEDSVQLGVCTVSCEGYRTGSDPYVLRGSCGLAYNLEYTNWAPYLWAKALRILSIMIWTPLKWLSYAAASLLVGLVVLTLIRRPALRARHASQGKAGEFKKKSPPKVKYVKVDEDEDEDEDLDEEDVEEEETVWSGRLRSKRSAGKAGR